MKVEEKALVLDFLPRGRSSDFKTEPVAQVIGNEFFTLLEVVPKQGIELKALEEVYVGKEERQHIDHIKKRISYRELTNNSLAELEKAVEKIVEEGELRFVGFYNDSRSITIKRHQLELLSGMGKKHLMQVLSEREKGPFTSFEDIRQRVHGIPDPLHSVVRRVVNELEGEDVKHFVFVRPPSQEREFSNPSGPARFSGRFHGRGRFR